MRSELKSCGSSAEEKPIKHHIQASHLRLADLEPQSFRQMRDRERQRKREEGGGERAQRQLGIRRDTKGYASQEGIRRHTCRRTWVSVKEGPWALERMLPPAPANTLKSDLRHSSL
jgi:hypothetical protein